MNKPRRVSKVVGAIVSLALVVAVLGACQAPGSLLRGRLTTPTGTHVGGVAVTVYSNSTDAIVAQTTTDLDGDYSFLPDVLADGTYRIRFADADWWSGASDWSEATPVQASVDAPATVNATVSLATGSVSGEVSGVGQPSAEVEVVAMNATSGSAVAKTTTAADGTYGFAALPTGDYAFRFDAPGLPTRYNDGALTREAAPVVTITEGAATTGIDTVLAASSTITGRVTDADEPLSGIYVLGCEPITGTCVTYTTTAVDGTFTLSGIDDIAYTLVFFDRAENVITVYGSSSTDPSTGTPVTPVDGTIDIGTVSLTKSAPGAPTSVTAVPGEEVATVAWTAPTDGGSAITQYVATASTGQSCTSDGATTCVVTGLTNHVATTFTVTATNAVGTGAVSAPSPAVTPIPRFFCILPHDGANFAGASFTNADLSGCSFVGADFTGSSLAGASLRGADLGSADLTDADLTGADLRGADLEDTKLSGATLTGAKTYTIVDVPASLPTGWRHVGPLNLELHGLLIGPGADLTGGTFGGDFEQMDLSGVNLTDTTFYGNFAGVNLTDANLTRASLQPFFRDTSLAAADLTGANLTGASLDRVDLTRASITGADLTGAIFRDVNLHRVRSAGIIGTPALLPPRWSIAGGHLVGPDVDLIDADLTDADLADADLSGAWMVGTNLTRTDLAAANLTGVHSGLIVGTPASLPSGWALHRGMLLGRGAVLPGASLDGLDLSDIDLSEAYLLAASFVGTNLTGANLAGAFMFSADFEGADLTGANLTGADLGNATLAGADLTGATVADAVFMFADLGSATTGNAVTSSNLIGVPASLPAGWSIVDGRLVEN